MNVDTQSVGQSAPPLSKIRWGVLLLCIVMSAVQVFMAIYDVDVLRTSFVSHLLGAFAFFVLFVLVLAVNPLLRLVRVVRPLSRAELMVVFLTLLVTVGICEHGLSSTLVPIIVTPYTTEWNTPQRGWSEHVIPQLNPALYIQDPREIATFNLGWGPVTIDRNGEQVILLRPPSHAGLG